MTTPTQLHKAYHASDPLVITGQGDYRREYRPPLPGRFFEGAAFGIIAGVLLGAVAMVGFLAMAGR